MCADALARFLRLARFACASVSASTLLRCLAHRRTHALGTHSRARTRKERGREQWEEVQQVGSKLSVSRYVESFLASTTLAQWRTAEIHFSHRQAMMRLARPLRRVARRWAVDSLVCPEVRPRTPTTIAQNRPIPWAASGLRLIGSGDVSRFAGSSDLRSFRAHSVELRQTGSELTHTIGFLSKRKSRTHF